MKKLFGSIIVAAVGLSACTQSYYDSVNVNPNSSTNASVDLVLSNALKTTAAPQVASAGITNYAIISEWMNYWSPSGSYAISSSDGSSYKETTDFADNNGFWSNNYNNLEDYQYIEQTATASNQYFYAAAAKVMKAYIYQQLVDLFNNVPYTEALKGAANLTPKYDNGKDIYEALSTDLGAAVTLFQRADAVGSATQDVLFAGSNTSWAKFANTLRLRLLLRQTEAVPSRTAYIQGEITKIALNGAGFLTIDAGVNPGYSNSSGKQSPLFGFAINTAGTYIQDFWQAAKLVIDFSVAHNDPRYTRWYAPITGGAYVGCVLGAGGNPVGSASSTFGPGCLKSVSQPAILLSASESYFLQAEAILRGFTGVSGSDLTMFNNGVQASFTYLGAGSSAAYTSQAGDKSVNYAACVTFNEKLNVIMRQKWLAMQDVSPLESYADYRRVFYLGLPWTTPGPTLGIVISQNPGRDADAIPVRSLYPTIEYQTNPANVGAQGTPNHHTSKIWWMP